MKNEPSIKQLQLIDNLFVGMSQIKAYKEAGYEGKGNAGDVSASEIIRKPKVQAEIKKRLADIANRNRIRLGRISETALAQLLSLIQTSAEDRVKLDAVKDALDRAGLKPVEKQSVEGGLDITIRYANEKDRNSSES